MQLLSSEITLFLRGIYVKCQAFARQRTGHHVRRCMTWAKPCACELSDVNSWSCNFTFNRWRIHMGNLKTVWIFCATQQACNDAHKLTLFLIKSDREIFDNPVSKVHWNIQTFLCKSSIFFNSPVTYSLKYFPPKLCEILTSGSQEIRRIYSHSIAIFYFLCMCCI